ncbi:MAG TPA: hypothetical protein VEX18_06580, partial [Polyangiaceae bacterium]|nr:hypothetical protein [Polyangiaceae bacterium]
MSRTWLELAAALSLAMLAACSKASDQREPTYLSRELLLDPETCRDCHSTHYREWAGSMHAYASIDPVFLA